MRELRAVGANASPSGKPAPAKSQANGAALSARIDDDPTDDALDANGVEYKVVPYGSDLEEGNLDLVIKARDAEGLETAQKIVKEALEKADTSTHTAYLTFPDRGAFPRIIGTKGNVITELCSKTEADIYVPRDENTITIHGMLLLLWWIICFLDNAPGTEQAVANAKTQILRVAFGGPKGGRRHDRD